MVGRRYDAAMDVDGPGHATTRATDPLDQRPLGLGIGLALVVMVLGLPWLLVPLWWVFANVVALVTGRDFSSDTVNVPLLLVGLVATVTLLVLGAMLLVGLAGRGLSPRRRGSA